MCVKAAHLWLIILEHREILVEHYKQVEKNQVKEIDVITKHSIQSKKKTKLRVDKTWI